MSDATRPELIMVGALMLVGRLHGTQPPYQLAEPAQLMPLPMPGGQVAWIVLPLPSPQIELDRAPLAAGPVDDQTARQYEQQLAAVKAAKAGLSLPGNGPRQRSH